MPRLLFPDEPVKSSECGSLKRSGSLAKRALSAASQKIGERRKSEMRMKIRNVNFKDPDSTVKLETKLHGLTKYGMLGIGKYLSHKTYHYWIQFGGRLLPIDFFLDDKHPQTAVTQLKCDPPNTSLPQFFVQIGRLRYTYTNTIDLGMRSPDGEHFESDTYFVLAVNIADRQAWALWNPDQFEESGGVLPGFEKVCTAIPFKQSIEELLVNLQSRVLSLNSENAVTLPPGTTVRYGGVDAEGWTNLACVSAKYKAVHTHARRWTTVF